MAVAAEVITYITNAFPNAPHLLGQIVSKYAPQLTWCAAFGLSAVWEYVYDRLHEQNPETIPLTSASEKVAETSSPSGQGPHIRNGYSDADKKALEQILENATKLEPKGQLHQYCKKGTYDDAKQDLEKLSGNMEEKEPKVWSKKLPNGKTAIVREKSTYQDAKATLEIQKPNTKGASIAIIKIRYL
ncbi:unnamed protein product [Didymodactylos carnosus]|uniref:Uncharacterized protein n=1 Tax=Didymodactylos carnosus TaxID=1234261 RepID=A0A815HES8_9BILA|nr:unnamed protein product [Didymodactylos carnosus]CAF4220644.1 unnamed protein product [Didymodactylos carnosus]